MTAASSSRRLKPGALLEVQTPRGLSYVQYVGKHAEYGDVIRVLPGCHERRMTDFAALIAKTGYLAFYPARAAVTRGSVEIVGLGPLPGGVAVPRSLRRAGARGRTGEILTWIVENGKEETLRRELTEAEKKLPIAAIWNHELLVLRMSQRWSPEQEG
jgi:hypothetical protein